MSDELEETSAPGQSVPGGAEADEAEDRVVHEYDGIQEYDNRLPNWWLYTLFGSIVFAGLYWIDYHVLEIGELPNAEYAHALTEAKAAEDEARKEAQIESAGSLAVGSPGPVAPVTGDAVVVAARDPREVAEGKRLFITNCAPCHGPDGGGKIGPNLTDNAWIHGGAPEKIFQQIASGSPSKGMIAWGPQLGAARVLEVAAFVVSIKNTNVPGGKAPQGDVEP